VNGIRDENLKFDRVTLSLILINDTTVYAAFVAVGNAQSLLRLLCNSDFEKVKECRNCIHHLWLELNKIATEKTDAAARLQSAQSKLDKMKPDLGKFRLVCDIVLADWELFSSLASSPR
jgi:hypothetical protein